MKNKRAVANTINNNLVKVTKYSFILDRKQECINTCDYIVTPMTDGKLLL